MQANQLVSIIIPTYNRVDFIPETINSIIQQTYSNWEAIIVDDGSDAENFLTIQKIVEQDSRIQLHKRFKETKGASVCRNIGLKLATGKYTLFLDSDDLLAPNCLEVRVKLMDSNPTIDFGVFQSVVFKENIKGKTVLWNIDTNEDDLLRFLRKDALWQTTSPLYKTSSLLNIGGFDENLIIWQDYELHTRTIYSDLEYRKFLDLAPDFYIRHHQRESISQKGFKRKEALLCREEILFGFCNELKKRNKFTKGRKNALVSAFIVHCKGWIEAFLDVQNAKRLWARVYDARLVNYFEFSLINFYLQSYTTEKINASVLNRISRKAISLILPFYFDKRTFLNKVRYNGQIN